MKKLFVTLLLISAVAAGNMFAQTATTSSTGPTEEKKVEMKSHSKAEVRKNAAAKNHENVSKHKRLEHKKMANAGDETKKDKVRDHKEQIIEKAGGKAEAKQMLRKKQMQRKQDKKDE